VDDVQSTSAHGNGAQGRLNVDITRHDRAALVTIGGELDLGTSPQLSVELERIFVPEVELIVLDLRELEFMDSTGLVVLIRAHQRTREGGQRLAVVNGGNQVQKLLRITRVAESLTLVDAPEELLPLR
jgi:anti-anti-sigma factor